MEDAEQLDLGIQRQFADFVQEQGATIGFLEAADLAVECAGEGAALMAEQFRFDEILGNRAAIDRDQRLLRARAGGVDGIGDDFLADAAFPLDQHRHAGTGGLGGDGEGRAEAGDRSDDLVKGERGGDFFRQWTQFAAGRACADGRVQRRE